MWGTEKLIGKLKDFIAKVKAYFDGLTTNTKAEAALLKEMRDGGLHYLENIVEAYVQPLNFLREIDGTTYAVRAFFSEDARENITEKVQRIILKSDDNNKEV